MFDIGFSELLIIALVALLVLGPRRLPEAARTAGRWMARMRRFVSEVRHDFDREMRNAEVMDVARIKQELDTVRQTMADIPSALTQEIGAVPSDTGAATTAKPTARAGKRGKTSTKRHVRNAAPVKRRR